MAAITVSLLRHQRRSAEALTIQMEVPPGSVRNAEEGLLQDEW